MLLLLFIFDVYLDLLMFFLLLLLFFIHFQATLHVTGTLSWLLRSVKASNCSELYPDYFLIAFSFSSFASATVVSGHFLPTRVFYLTLLPDSFGTTCFYQGLPGSRQVFLEVCRDSY